DQVVQIRSAHFSMKAWTEGDIVIDGLREWIGLLNHHADATAEFNGIRRAGENVRSMQVQCALSPSPGNEVIHSVDPAKECTFAAAGWPNQCGHPPFRNLHREVD